MNLARLLKALRDKGFTGKTADEAIAFMKENGIALKPKGAEKAMDDAAIKAAWAVVETVEIEDEEVTEPEVETKSAEEIAAEAQAKALAYAEAKNAEAALRASRKAAADAVRHQPTNKGMLGITDTKRLEAHKAYALKIKKAKFENIHPTHKDAAVFETPEEAEFAGAFLRLAVAATKNFTYGQMENDKAIVKSVCTKASTELNNTSAGVLVPPQFYAVVLWLTEFYGTARKIANVQRFSKTDEWKRPRKTAIMAMQYIGESATITATDNSYDLIGLTPRKYGGLMIVSTELFEDSAVSIGDEFTKAVAEGQAIAEDQAYFLGDGSATYGNQTGLKNALPAGAYIAGGATWSVFSLAGLTNMPGLVENIVGGGTAPCYVSSRQAFYQTAVRLMNAGGGNKGVDIQTFTPLKPGPNGANAMFNGEPWYFAQVMPTATPSTGIPSIYYGDFTGASMLGVHTDLRIATDTSRYFDSDQIAFRAISRFDVNIHGDGRGSTIGPIVCTKIT